MLASKMLLSSPLTPTTHFSNLGRLKTTRPNSPTKISCTTKQTNDVTTNTTAQTIAIATGLTAAPTIAWSLYTLKTIGCGLPPGPGGSLGALEGVSYLAIVAIVAWSLYTKVKTGSGLPSGPFGLLGAVEGLSYLCLFAVLGVFGFQLLEVGSLPGPLPSEQCFG